ncbi:hypothetical protein [Micromonospora sp. NPDC005087]|uniref:hypothetical protein n=1 Tax=Micromonospora sp. NPDC005087 TaxID=3364225 RepID=UPI00368CF38A
MPVRQWLLLAAVLLVGLNLRGPIAAASPVLRDVKADLGLSSGTAGLLTTLPVQARNSAAPRSPPRYAM